MMMAYSVVFHVVVSVLTLVMLRTCHCLASPAPNCIGDLSTCIVWHRITVIMGRWWGAGTHVWCSAAIPELGSIRSSTALRTHSLWKSRCNRKNGNLDLDVVKMFLCSWLLNGTRVYLIFFFFFCNYSAFSCFSGYFSVSCWILLYIYVFSRFMSQYNSIFQNNVSMFRLKKRQKPSTDSNCW